MDQRFIRVDFEFILEHIVCDHLVMNPQDLTGLFWSSLCVMSCLCWHYKVSVLTLHKPDQFDLNFSGSCMYPLGSSGCRCVLSLSLFNIFSCLLLLVHGWDWALSNTGASGSSHWLKLKYEKKVLLFFFFFWHNVPCPFCLWPGFFWKCSRNVHCKCCLGHLSALQLRQSRALQLCVNWKRFKDLLHVLSSIHGLL